MTCMHKTKDDLKNKTNVSPSSHVNENHLYLHEYKNYDSRIDAKFHRNDWEPHKHWNHVI